VDFLLSGGGFYLPLMLLHLCGGSFSYLLNFALVDCLECCHARFMYVTARVQEENHFC